MKTKNLLLVLTLMFSLSLFAEHIPMETAKKVALNFYFEKFNQYESSIDFAAIQISNIFTKKQEQETFYYVFSFTHGGFVIVSADDCLNPVLGYSFKHEFVSENQPPNVQWWFQQFEDQVIYVRDNKLKPTEKIAERWVQYQTNDIDRLHTAKRDDEVGPLLTTLWNQGWSYNYYCPETPIGGSGGHVWAGCVTTAAAQIGYYWRWPDHGQGYTSYIPASHPEYGLQYADFENTWYRYDEMCDEPQTVNLAIAEYTYHIAVGLHMDFGTGGSVPTMIDSVHYYFKYFPFECLYRDSMPDEQWKEILTNMLDDDYPIYYAGYITSGVGHAFVCDGYQDEDFYHFNLGWGGQSNGYYTIDNILGYNYGQWIHPVFCPDTIAFSYPQYCSGMDTCLILEGSITDGSGPVNDYLNNTQASWLIDPQNEMDSVINIELHVKHFHLHQGDYLRIYNGADNTAPLLAEFTGDTLPGVLESTGNKVFVEFTSNGENTAPGFYLSHYAQIPVFCTGQEVLNDSIKRFNDGSGRFYYQNNKVCTWLLQPEGCDSSLTLYFDYFDTEAGQDILLVYDMQTQELLAEYSGYYEDAPPPVVSPNGSMLLAFVANKSVRGQGWSVYYGDFTGIDEPKSIAEFSIYPNPASNELTLNYRFAKKQQLLIKLYSMSGKVIKTFDLGLQNPGNHSKKLNINELPPGIYILRLQTDSQVVTRKVVKIGG